MAVNFGLDSLIESAEDSNTNAACAARDWVNIVAEALLSARNEFGSAAVKNHEQGTTTAPNTGDLIQVGRQAYASFPSATVGTSGVIPRDPEIADNQYGVFMFPLHIRGPRFATQQQVNTSSGPGAVSLRKCNNISHAAYPTTVSFEDVPLGGPGQTNRLSKTVSVSGFSTARVARIYLNIGGVDTGLFQVAVVQPSSLPSGSTVAGEHWPIWRDFGLPTSGYVNNTRYLPNTIYTNSALFLNAAFPQTHEDHETTRTQYFQFLSTMRPQLGSYLSTNSITSVPSWINNMLGIRLITPSNDLHFSVIGTDRMPITSDTDAPYRSQSNLTPRLMHVELYS